MRQTIAKMGVRRVGSVCTGSYPPLLQPVGFYRNPTKNGCESPFCAAESGFGVHLRPKSLPYETPTGLYAETERTQKPRSPSEFRKPKVRRHPKAVFMQKRIINKARRYRRCGFASGALRNVLSLKASPAQQRVRARGASRCLACGELALAAPGTASAARPRYALLGRSSTTSSITWPRTARLNSLRK